MHTLQRRGRRLGALAFTGALLIAGCASEESGGGDTTDSTGEPTSVDSGSIVKAGWVNETDLEPTTGGTLQVTLPTPPSGLDPTVASLGVTTGGAPLMAIYDSLLQWEPETNTYSGRLAESISSNDDFSVWTLKLKPDLTFSDGTPVNSQAVVFSIERMRSARGSASTYPDYFSSLETPDDLTVVMNLKAPLNNVDALLASDLGYVVSPTAVQADPENFNTNPVGAGPFLLESFDPTSEMVLVKNPDYGLGDVALDGIRFTWSSEQNANVDKLMGGAADLILLTSITEEVRAIEGGYPASSIYVAGSGMAVNSAPDRAFPGDDPRVRQAMAMAIDIESVNERVNNGEGIMGPYLFAPGSIYNVDTPFSTYDPDEARRLLDEVKAETGWDGSFQLTTPPPTDYALAYQGQLNAVGFNATIDPVQSFIQLVERTNISRNFDVAIHVITTYETNVYQALHRSLSTGSRSNYSGYTNPEMDALFDQLRATPDAEGTREVLTQVAELWQTEQPFLLTGNQPFTTVTGKNVGGVQISANGLILFDEVFKS
jgi:peptide/nickel transport system substrate-binding protein